MLDYLTLGPTPSGEGCEQLGPRYDPRKARAECLVFVHQLQRLFPHGVFKVKSFAHDFGSYMEVCAVYDDSYDDDITRAAFAAEANTPENWDEAAKIELKNALAALKEKL